MSDNAFTPSQGVPASLTAGDFWTWRVDGFTAAYDLAVYELDYTLTPKSGGAAFNIPATADADGRLVSVPSTSTQNLGQGKWGWVLRATRLSDSAAVSIMSGVVDVLPNPTATSVASAARKMLAAIDAVLENRITKDVEAYTIEGRSLTRIPFLELRAMRTRLAAEVAAEDRAASGKIGVMKIRKMGFPDAR